MENEESTPRPVVCGVSWVIAAAGLLAALIVAVVPTRVTGEVDSGLVNLGRSLYRTYCKSCHGDVGKGDGALAGVLSVPPADLTVLSRKNDGEFPLEEVAKSIDGRESVAGHLSSDMPDWGDAFERADEGEGEKGVKEKVTALAHYLQSIQVTSEGD